MATPYGEPSAPVSVGEVGGRRVAFLPRHGRAARVPAPPDQLPRQPLGAAFARRPPGAGAVRGRWAPRRGRPGRPGRARPARRPHRRAGTAPTSSAARCTCPSPTPTARACPPRWPRPTAYEPAARWWSSTARASRPAPSRRTTPSRGWTLDQHDRSPRGGVGPRAADVPGDDRPGHRHGRRGRAPTRASGSRTSSPCSRRTPSGSRRCSPASSPTCRTPPAAPATPGQTAST